MFSLFRQGINCVWIGLALLALTLDAAERSGFRDLFNGRDLTGWVDVNTSPETWKIREGVLICSGKPHGVMRTDRQYENFILQIEWRHMEAGGNSGVFVWSDANPQEKNRLPKGCEVQMLELEWPKLNPDKSGKPRHPGYVSGELFGANGLEATPDNPRGSRSMSYEYRCNGKGEWNSYEVVCVDGVVKLAINGKFVNGLSKSSVKKGYICLESEGSEIHFRNIRILELPPGRATPEETAPLAETPRLSTAAPEFDIRLDVASTGFDKTTCWVHPRAAAIPGPTPAVVMTMSKLLLSGSDVFYAINELRTNDLGRTWTGPRDHVDTLGRRPVDQDITEGVADFWPKWHAGSGRILGLGAMVRYKGDAQVPHYPRRTVYSTYDPATRQWSPWVTLEMPSDPRFYSEAAACTQRVDLPNGDILIPVYHRAEGSRVHAVTVLRCGFDGTTLRVKEYGNALSLSVDRGFVEPSLTVFQGRYYLTIRNDRAGYVATSLDGLHFSAPRPWTWDVGGELGSYNTQQHWVAHDNALYLVYTRRGADNDHIFRNRAPLFIAQVDPEKLQVIRSTERILIPEYGARLGNFGVTEVNENETWITDAEWMQATAPNPYDYTVPMQRGSNNRIFVARIQWKTPNRTWNER
ncbi:MAG TPA: DUF1080 domain-containing protein [Opitutaceae bacterium]|nr:DUF1080 domain-containing protein [Opitutaceae bacterium]